MGMRAFDDHISCGVDVNTRRVARVGLHKPDDNGDVVGNPLIHHGNSAISLKKIDGAAIVVDEGGSLGLKRWVCVGERDKVLSNQPFDVFRVRQSRWAAL